MVKNRNFYGCLFFYRKRLVILLNNILERKPAFLNYKKVIFKKSKNLHFCKGVNPWFGFKNFNFHASLFLFKKHLAILFINVLNRKPAFLNYKKVILKKAKKFPFLQRVLLVSQPGVFGEKIWTLIHLCFSREHALE